jgi:hypothetical protein
LLLADDRQAPIIPSSDSHNVPKGAVQVGPLQNLKNRLRRVLVERAGFDTALREAVGEVAFVWAHFQLVAKPENALDEQILSFGLAGTLEGIQGMLRGKRRLREPESWEVLFAGIVQAQAYCHRHTDEDIRGAIAKVKTQLCPPPRRWPEGSAELIRRATMDEASIP